MRARERAEAESAAAYEELERLRAYIANAGTATGGVE